MRLAKTLLCTLLLAATPARAEETASADAGAQKAFEEAKELFNSSNFAEASAKFREANRLRPSWKLYFNIAQSEAAAKRHGLALEAFEMYVAQAGDDIPENRRELVLSEMERLRPIVGFVTIISKEHSDASVIIDDFPRGTLPLSGPLMIAAGIDHTVRIEEGEAVLLERGVKVAGKQTVHIDLDEALAPTAAPPAEAAPVPEPEPQDTPSSQPPQGPSTKRILGISGIAVGGALLIAGAVTGGLALGKFGDLENSCPENQCPSTGDADKADSVDKLALATDVLLPTGAVIGAVGIILLVLSRGDETASDTPVSLSPILAPDAGGVSIEGRF